MSDAISEDTLTILRPFGDLGYALAGEIRKLVADMSAAELAELQAGVRKLNGTNCGWGLYGIREVLANELQRAAYLRHQGQQP